jgi:hypothetical protein
MTLELWISLAGAVGTFVLFLIGIVFQAGLNYGRFNEQNRKIEAIGNNAKALSVDVAKTFAEISALRQADRETVIRLDERVMAMGDQLGKIVACLDRLEQRMIERTTPRARRGSDQTVE